MRTRLLIISDTHGSTPFSSAKGFSLPKADVLIHCGDLTTKSELYEYEATFNMLREIDANLKLVIPGNHDGVLDTKYWDDLCEAKRRWASPFTLATWLQRPHDAHTIVQKARHDGIHVLIGQGTYHFILANGAKFTVYASPWTPAYGFWGFQYADVEDSSTDTIGRSSSDCTDNNRLRHSFSDLQPGTDLAMTHGPPYGILDTTHQQDRVGCRMLRECVQRARPRVHCFGHIHEAAGYAVATWDVQDEKKTGNVNDEIVENVSQPGKGLLRQLSLCEQDATHIDLEEGRQTLFINAAVMDTRLRPDQSPWILDMDLPFPDEEHKRKANETGQLLAAVRAGESP
ncbi:Metallo-dependent phosphatase-like protein [Coniella lustricola]|uniref:Metallo-dependent phosphatase-like protein n=1 Tax=Coniella lustricola TaxID=2025994 RepID=A0A2T3AA23_9PEZI|nr:Metallo-dependent phosphatase-like protein [Coniella lustricola]